MTKKITAPILRDVSNLSPKEIDELKAAINRRDAKLRSAPATAPAPLAASLPVAAPRGPALQTRSWVCPRCQEHYEAVRCLDQCPGCLPIIQEERAQQRRRELHASILAQAGEYFEHVRLDHPKLKQWVKSPKAIASVRGWAVLEYDEDRECWCFLVLLGETGLGKTTLGSAVFRHHLDRVLAPGATEADEEYVRGMYWVPAIELARARRETPLGATVKKLKRALNATVLLLDDLGQEPPELKDDLMEVLSERHRHRRKTIVTCGWGLGADPDPEKAREGKSIEQRYGPQIARRLGQGAHVLAMKGQARG